MSQKNPIPIPTYLTGSETGLNKAVKDISADLALKMGNLKMLGLSERRVNANGVVYPACFQTNASDWLNLLPCDFWKPGYLFIDATDPQEPLYGKEEDGLDTIPAWRVNIALIAYIDLSHSDYVTVDYRSSRQEFKDLLINTITRQMLTFKGTMKINRVFDREIEQIFKGYSVKEVDGQYMQMPYYGIRIECEITYSGRCIT